jgi:hypothetical protein
VPEAIVVDYQSNLGLAGCKGQKTIQSQNLASTMGILYKDEGGERRQCKCKTVFALGAKMQREGEKFFTGEKRIPYSSKL